MVESSEIGRVTDFQNLEGLNGDHAADVVLLEYQDNNPALDYWIAQTTAQPLCPEIFLFVPEVLPPFIWKALKLGAREIFPGTIQPEEFHDAILRVGVRKASLAGWLSFLKASGPCWPAKTWRDKSCPLRPENF